MRTLRLSTFRLAIAFGLGYLLGTVPSADLVSRRKGVNLRDVGSRNPGALNAGRVLGNPSGRAVLVIDVAKGYSSGVAGSVVAGDLGAHVAGTAAVLGHCYPVWSGFRGGKGLATTFGQGLFTFPAGAPAQLGLALGVARVPGLPRAGVVSTAVPALAWLLLSLLWWRRKLPNSWGPEPSGALVVANTVTVLVVASRFVAAHRRGDPDELEPTSGTPRR
jgi:glycerol-3-phosphate acyltransferase PlsY